MAIGRDAAHGGAVGTLEGVGGARPTALPLLGKLNRSVPYKQARDKAKKEDKYRTRNDDVGFPFHIFIYLSEADRDTD
jgi:hypothetical protein